jgi:hypothetical protein
MATHQGRADVLELAVASIAPQVDFLQIYLNDYKTIPSFLRKYEPKCKAILGRLALGDIGPFGKFYHHQEPRCDYILTVDDDFIYPPDYVEKSTQAVQRYGGKALISFHGIIMPERAISMEPRDAPRVMGTHNIPQDVPVNWLGTGMMSYDASRLCISNEILGQDRLVDPCLAIWAQQNRVPMVVAAHAGDWVTPLEMKSKGKKLHHVLNRNDPRLIEKIRATSPWEIFPASQVRESKSISCVDIPETTEERPGYDAILTVYKRDNLRRQVEYLHAQTAKPNNIFVWQNGNHVPLSPGDVAKLGARLISSRHVNWRYHGRFVLPLLLNSEYILMLDDDCFPGPEWVEKALRLCRRRKCIAGARGALYTGGDYYDAVEDPARTTEVDFVGHAWVFRREWISHVWKHRNLRWDNGEDMHISAACKIEKGIRTFVPAVSSFDGVANQDKRAGADRHAGYKRPNHHENRMAVMQDWVRRGWVLVDPNGNDEMLRGIRQAKTA